MGRIRIETPDEEELKALGVENWTNWECEPSTFDWEYDEDETAYVLEGKVRVKTEDGEEVEFGKGNLVRFPKGLRCTWTVIERIRKKYTFR